MNFRCEGGSSRQEREAVGGGKLLAIGDRKSDRMMHCVVYGQPETPGSSSGWMKEYSQDQLINYDDIRANRDRAGYSLDP
jgi:hypothetical protein